MYAGHVACCPLVSRMSMPALDAASVIIGSFRGETYTDCVELVVVTALQWTVEPRTCSVVKPSVDRVCPRNAERTWMHGCWTSTSRPSASEVKSSRDVHVHVGLRRNNAILKCVRSRCCRGFWSINSVINNYKQQKLTKYTTFAAVAQS